MLPLIGSLGTPELLIILGIVVLLFGATKLPDLARGSGRALRIFKAETKGLTDIEVVVKEINEGKIDVKEYVPDSEETDDGA